MKKIFFAVTLIVSSLSMNAQDILVWKGGEVENVKVLEVTPTEVRYKKANNLNGPSFTEKRSSLISVKYENGETQKFNNTSSFNGGDGWMDNGRYLNYNRVFIGYAQTKITADDFDESLHGFSAGWLGGYNVIKGRKLPLYVEAGITMNVGLGECVTDFDKLLNFEVPINITYRYNFKNTKICLSPYFGLHFKVNALALNEDGDSYFDIDGFRRFQMGLQLGANIEFNHFYIGAGWNYDFLPLAKIKHFYIPDYRLKSTYKVISSGARVNIGFVF